MEKAISWTKGASYNGTIEVTLQCPYCHKFQKNNFINFVPNKTTIICKDCNELIMLDEITLGKIK